jgi:hypothetical protein
MVPCCNYHYCAAYHLVGEWSIQLMRAIHIVYGVIAIVVACLVLNQCSSTVQQEGAKGVLNDFWNGKGK